MPDGDQFLFVTAPGGDRIEVTFVDPDAEPVSDEADGGSTIALDVSRASRARRRATQAVRFVLGELDPR